MTTLAGVDRVGELEATERKIEGEELGLIAEAFKADEPSIVGNLSTEASGSSKRARITHVLYNMSLAGSLLASALDTTVECPAREVLADEGSFPAQLPGDKDSKFLRASTYNIFEGKKGISKVIQTINSAHSDIVGLQEVNAEVLPQIEAATDYKNVLIGYAHDGKGGFYGVALLTNYPVLSKNTYSLESGPDYERRVALVVTLLIDGQPTVVVVSHLINKEPGLFGDDREDERLHQIQNLLGILGRPEYASHPQMVLVDANSGRLEEPRDLLDLNMNSASQQLGIAKVTTFPSDATEKDVIYTSKPSGLEPIELSISGGNGSDHCQVEVTFRKSAV